MKRFEYKYSDLQYPVRMNNDCSNLFMPYDNYPGYQQGLVLDLPLSKVVEYIDVPFIEKYEGEITIEKMENYITYGTRKAKSFVYFCNMGTLGSEGGDGTAENPWASVGYALKKLKPLVDCVYFNYCGQVYITLRCSGTTSDTVCCHGDNECGFFNGLNIVVIEGGRLNFRKILDEDTVFGIDGIRNCVFKNCFFDLNFSANKYCLALRLDANFFWGCNFHSYSKGVVNSDDDGYYCDATSCDSIGCGVDIHSSYFFDCDIELEEVCESHKERIGSFVLFGFTGVFCKCNINIKSRSYTDNFSDATAGIEAWRCYFVDCVIKGNCVSISKNAYAYSQASGCWDRGASTARVSLGLVLIRTNIKLELTAIAPDEYDHGSCDKYGPYAVIDCRRSWPGNSWKGFWYKSSIILNCDSSRGMYQIDFSGGEEGKHSIYECTLPKERCEGLMSC